MKATQHGWKNPENVGKFPNKSRWKRWSVFYCTHKDKWFSVLREIKLNLIENQYEETIQIGTLHVLLSICEHNF